MPSLHSVQTLPPVKKDSTPKLMAQTLCFGGEQRTYEHFSEIVDCRMRFSLFLPPAVLAGERCPCIVFLSGLTCTEQNAAQKSGFQRIASALGLIVICPDTSPRGADIADAERYDLGQGAGFYLNAILEPWTRNYRMYDYVVDEITTLAATLAPVSCFAISGHSMGGHGALVIGMRNPEKFLAISAFAPIIAPSQVPWGQLAFWTYLGDNPKLWNRYDCCAIMARAKKVPPILIDQGSADEFLEQQLRPWLFKPVIDERFPVIMRTQEGYDHSYHFVASFIDEHFRFLHKHCQHNSA